MSKIKEVHGETKLFVPFFDYGRHVWQPIVVVVVRTRPRAIPLAMITMTKSTHGFPFLPHDEYGAPLKKETDLNKLRDTSISPIITGNIWQSAAIPCIKEAQKTAKL